MRQSHKKNRLSDKDRAYQSLSHRSYRPEQSTHFHVPERQIEHQKRRFGWKRALLLLFLLLLTPLLVIGIWDYRNFSRASNKMFGSNSAFSLLAPSPLKNTDGRVNILLIGYSADDPGHAGAKLTDSILVLSINKDKKTGYMLSIPRDLYVDIPDYGPAKINEAYQAGETMTFNEPSYPIGGVGLLEKVITDAFGIEFHYHAIINYGTVRDVVDALGGVTVTIESPDPRGLLDPNFRPQEGGPLQLANGPHVLDGQTALRLTRARGSTYGSYGFPQSDFNRTQNQQKVFGAILDQLSWTLVLDPRTNGKIFDAAAANITTNVRIFEVLPLYRLFTAVPLGDLQSISLNKVNNVNLLRGYTTRSGQSALIPAAGIDDYTQIRATIEGLNQ
jgi:LCP family protein required for cell wall assembly